MNHSTITNSILFILLIVGTVALYGLGLDRAGLFDVDEAIFAEASVEMLESGDYVRPTYNGEPRYHKPPMIYWLQSASMAQFDISPQSARLPSAALGVLTIFAFFIFLEKMTKNVRYALTAAAILAFSLSFTAIARAAIADMLLNFLILTATFTFLANLYAEKRSNWLVFIGGFLLGAGLLAKGPIALLVPGIVVGLVVFLRGNLIYNLKCVNPFIALFAIAIAIAPWCIHIIKANGLDFFQEFIWVHNIQRYFEGLGNSNSSSPFYYLIVLFVGFFPWAMFIPSSIMWIFEDFISRLRSIDPMDALPAIGLIWLIAVVLFFSFSHTKLPHYIVPALPGAAMLIAARLDDIRSNEMGPITILTFPLLAIFAFPFLALKWLPSALVGEGAMASTAATIASFFGGSLPIDDEQLTYILSQNIEISSAPFIMGGIVIFGVGAGIWLLMHNSRAGTFTIAASMFMAITLTCISIVPTVYEFMQRPLANIAEQIKDVHKIGDEVYYVELHQPSVRFVSGIPFTPISSMAELSKLEPTGRKLFVVEQVRLERMKANLPKGGKHAAECEGGFCLVAWRANE